MNITPGHDWSLVLVRLLKQCLVADCHALMTGQAIYCVSILFLVVHAHTCAICVVQLLGSWMRMLSVHSFVSRFFTYIVFCQGYGQLQLNTSADR